MTLMKIFTEMCEDEIERHSTLQYFKSVLNIRKMYWKYPSRNWGRMTSLLQATEEPFCAHPSFLFTDSRDPEVKGSSFDLTRAQLSDQGIDLLSTILNTHPRGRCRVAHDPLGP